MAIPTITKAEVSYFKDIPKYSETTERILTKEPLDKNLLSFQDGLYEEIFKYLGHTMNKVKKGIYLILFP